MILKPGSVLAAPSWCPSSRGLLLDAMTLLAVLLASHVVSHIESDVSLSHYSALLLGNENLPNDLDLWPTTLTYNPSLAKVKVNHHTKNQGHRSNGLAVRVLTDGMTEWRKDGKTAPILLPRPLTREVKTILSASSDMRRFWGIWLEPDSPSSNNLYYVHFCNRLLSGIWGWPTCVISKHVLKRKPLDWCVAITGH